LSEENDEKEEGKDINHNQAEPLQRYEAKRDPLTFIIWGILMLAYGIYLLFSVLVLESMDDSLFNLIQSMMLLTLGGVSLLYGYRKNKKIKVIIK
jgi:hypothetical protein